VVAVTAVPAMHRGCVENHVLVTQNSPMLSVPPEDSAESAQNTAFGAARLSASHTDRRK